MKTIKIKMNNLFSLPQNCLRIQNKETSSSGVKISQNTVRYVYDFRLGKKICSGSFEDVFMGFIQDGRLQSIRIKLINGQRVNELFQIQQQYNIMGI
ncbi:unnamed protein product [Paramecium sonneborni]|uniref:Uncharacterized protein n=1 Tax=Paramecium sonneborni TaxID=65129 RepID=A0A8S1RSR8_9CILI|nr:unnamed protein product [Paramecium sonneborni]